MLVHHFLEASAARSPLATALVCGQRRVSYRELDQAANRLAQALVGAGLRRGDRVMIVLENGVEAVVSIFAALKAGGVFVVLHPSTKPAKLELLLRDAEPFALVTDGPRLADAGAMLAASSVRCLVWADDDPPAWAADQPGWRWRDLDRLPPERPDAPTIDVDLACLIYTSGSTGQPKGVMATHANVVAATSSINAYLGNTAADVILDVLPLAFDYGLYQLFLAFQVGACVVLERGFAFPARLVELLARERVTGLPGVPTLYALLLKFPQVLERPLPALRYLTNTAAALPTSHIARLRAAFPNARIFSMYGQTECKRISYLPPEELHRRPGSVGVAIPNTEVAIVDAAGRPVPPGVVGELVVRGSHVTRGYWRAPELTAERFRPGPLPGETVLYTGDLFKADADGFLYFVARRDDIIKVRGSHVTRGYWRAPELTAERFRPGPLPGETVLYTGDLFKADADGFLYFVARRDDIIKVRGEKVSPREVENAVCLLPEVAEAAVVGVPDPVLGQALVLVVAPRPGARLGERQVRAHCQRSLDDYMVPKHVRLVPELPRTANGKVDKHRLADEAASATLCAESLAS
jgi:long-chain acyl-CoA synthetase